MARSSPPPSTRSTQPFSPSGHPWQPDTRDVGESPVSDSSELGRGATLIDISCSPGIVTWKTTDGDQYAPKLQLDLFLDGPANTAFFKLYGRVHLKAQKQKNTHPIYLFIPPEHVRTIAWKKTKDDCSDKIRNAVGDGSHSLCFSLSKPPQFIVPKNQPLESKNNTKDIFDSIKCLSKATDFTACFSRQKADPLLSQLAATFSEDAGNRPLANKARANLASLYKGKGGEIVSSGHEVADSDCATADSHPKIDPESCLPSYDKAILESGPSHSRKRQRTSNASPGDHERMILLLEAMNKNISHGMDVIHRRLDGFHDQLRGFHDRLDGLQSQMERLHEASSAYSRSCRYDSEERQDLLQDMHNTVEEAMLNARFELEEKLEEEFKETREEVKEDIEELKNNAHQSVKQLVDESMNTVLNNAKLELTGSASFKFRIEG